MSNWSKFQEFCNQQNYSLRKARRFFRSIIRKAAGVEEIDLDQVDQTKENKAVLLVKDSKKIWGTKNPQSIQHHIVRKRKAIQRRQERKDFLSRRLAGEKDPERKLINLNLIQKLADQINRFLAEIQRCRDRIDELTPPPKKKGKK